MLKSAEAFPNPVRRLSIGFDEYYKAVIVKCMNITIIFRIRYAEIDLEEKKVEQVTFTSILFDKHVGTAEWRVKGVNTVHFVDDLGRQHSHGCANRSRR